MPRRSARHAASDRLTEFPLIRDLARRFGRTGGSVLRGIGDDAAVLEGSKGKVTLVTTDLLAEGIHFELTTATCEEVGYKAAVANLSDIAAMGGTPRYVLVSLAVPASRSRSDVLRLYAGMMRACRPHRVELIGGDTSASRRDLFINLTLLGTAKPRQVLLRRGARAGDLLYVTGTLGDSLAGLQLLTAPITKGGRGRAVALAPHDRDYLIGRHLRPEARLRVGQLLAAGRLATAAIDVSDGLSGDLAHLCREGGVGAEVEVSALPLSPALRRYAEARRMSAETLALTGGEDYELLFAVSPGRATAVEALARSARCPVRKIGRFRPKAFGMKVVGTDRSLAAFTTSPILRSEERRVGKECRSRWSPYH